MTWYSKLLIFVFAALVLVAGTFIIYKQIEISARQEAIENQVVAQKELADNILRSMSKYASKDDLEKFAKDGNINLEAINKDLDSLNANIIAINQTLTSSRAQVVTGGGSSHTTPNPNPVDPKNPDPYGYSKNRQVIEISEQFDNAKVPFGQVGFSAWQEKPWDYTIAARQYKVSTVIATDENQRHYVYNKFAVNVNGKDYDIKITQAQTLEQYPEAKFKWWNPRLFLGMSGGVNVSAVRGEAVPSLSLGVMSYGKFNSQPDISLLHLGVGYGMDTKRPTFLVTPVSYNVGKHIPLMNNLYVGPSVGINTSGDISVLGTLNVGL